MLEIIFRFQVWGESWMYSPEHFGDTVRTLAAMAEYINHIEDSFNLDNVMAFELLNEPWAYLVSFVVVVSVVVIVVVVDVMFSRVGCCVLGGAQHNGRLYCMCIFAQGTSERNGTRVGTEASAPVGWREAFQTERWCYFSRAFP